MTIFIVLTFTAILSVFVFGTDQIIEEVKEICEDVKSADKYVCDLLKSPRPFNRGKLFPAIEDYIKRFERLTDCLNTHSNLTLEMCSAVFDEQGAHFMHIRFDWDDLINGFQWDERGMDDYESLRGKTLDAWLKCEKHIYKHISF